VIFQRRCLFKTVASLLVIVSLGACQKSESPEADDANRAKASAVLPHDDEVWATVEGQAITRYDVESNAKETLGVLGEVMITGSQREKLVKGLAMRKAMAHLREKELGQAERKQVEKDVEAYRERLLARQYVEARMKTRKVTEQASREYYDQNTEKFGARKLKVFELLIADLKKPGPARGSRLAELTTLGNGPEWSTPPDKSWLRWQRGSAELAGLPNKLRSEITRLDMGEKSGVIMLGDKAYIAKVTGLNERPARSFESVRDEIEETLEPRLYRDAVKELQSEALGNVEVTYSFK